MAISDIRKTKAKIIKDENIVTEIAKEKTTIYLSPSVKKNLQKLAIDEDKSMSLLIEIAIKDKFKI